MVNFCRPGTLGSLADFKQRYQIPIEAAQNSNSSRRVLKTGAARMFTLYHDLQGNVVLRRDGEFLKKQLPPKHEWVIFCRPSRLQHSLYRKFLKVRRQYYANHGFGRSSNKNVIGAYHIALSIINHPDVLLEAARRAEGSGDDILGDNGALQAEEPTQDELPTTLLSFVHAELPAVVENFIFFGTVLGIELREDLTVNKIIMDDTVDARDVCSRESILIGDRLVGLNGVSITEMKDEAVIELIMTLSRPLRMQFLRHGPAHRDDIQESIQQKIYTVPVDRKTTVLNFVQGPHGEVLLPCGSGIS